MNKEIPPAVTILAVVVLALIVAALYWRGSRKQYNLPAKPPSGPIVLPPSQQGRPMPGGTPSAPLPGSPATRAPGQ